tara:strand:- start:1970 stop:2977 length:1008 start_codon:yes stop_codon:yes gene_type:complete
MAQDNTNNFNRPIPLRQNEILRNNLSAPKDGANSDNPSFPIGDISPTNRQAQKTPVNRGSITRRDTDTTKDVSIGLQDHDEAIMYYFNNVIKPAVIMNGDRLDVPLIYGAPERWKSVQRDGFYRDKEGKIQTPIIMFKRNTIEKRRDLGNKMDANNPQLYYVSQKSYTKKNQYDNFTLLQGRSPQKEFHAVVIPDYVKLKYSFVIWTDYVAQMNKITEAINYASDSYWGDPERFKFNAKIDSFTNRVEVAQGSNRVVKTEFGLELQGYIITDTMSAELAKSPPKFYSKSVVKFGTEIITSGESSKTRDDVRNNEQKIGTKGTGIGFEGTDDNAIG